MQVGRLPNPQMLLWMFIYGNRPLRGQDRLWELPSWARLQLPVGPRSTQDSVIVLSYSGTPPPDAKTMKTDPSALRLETKGLSRKSYRSPRLNAIIMIPNCQTLLLVELQSSISSPRPIQSSGIVTLGRLRFGFALGRRVTPEGRPSPASRRAYEDPRKSGKLCRNSCPMALVHQSGMNKDGDSQLA
jgi:hypothetical protein